MKPTDSEAPLSRRLFLGLGTLVLSQGAGAGTPRPADLAVPRQHFPFGPVLPRRPAPSVLVKTHTGALVNLRALLNGRVSALQLMFTGCSATCPIQGALFAQAQAALGQQMPDAQFVSLSIDPQADTPSMLAAWLGGFKAQANWLAGAPRFEDLDRVVNWLGQGGEPRPSGTDSHTGQVYIVNRQGALHHRTVSMPPAATIVKALSGVAAGDRST